MCLDPRFFEVFQFKNLPRNAFWAFWIPDFVAIVGLSLLRAYWTQSKILQYVILGSFSYATLYCMSLSFDSNSGWLPTGIMFLGLQYNIFLCFHSSLFRTSNSGLAGNVFKTGIQIVCIWAIALVMIPAIILHSFGSLKFPSFTWNFYSGIMLLGLFSCLGLSSSFFLVRDGSGTPLPMDQTNELVVSGPYRYVRNPMAVAGIGQGIALSVLFWSVPILFYSLLGAVIWHFVVRPVEEKDMEARFGPDFLQYRNRVRCWLPRIHRR